MHATPTVDLEIVLAGQVELELDDGATVSLGAGDTIVQYGTRHAWHNRTGSPTTVAFVMLGAENQLRSATTPDEH